MAAGRRVREKSRGGLCPRHSSVAALRAVGVKNKDGPASEWDGARRGKRSRLPVEAPRLKLARVAEARGAVAQRARAVVESLRCGPASMALMASMLQWLQWPQCFNGSNGLLQDQCGDRHNGPPRDERGVSRPPQDRVVQDANAMGGGLQ